MREAFSFEAGLGGFVGVLIQGFRRACFSNEAGAGSAAIAHSAARTNEPLREGMVALLEPFVDTLIVCNVTGIVIVVTGAYANPEAGTGIAMTSWAFATVFPWFPVLLSLIAFLFAYSTMISWSYYGEQCWAHLFGVRSILLYKTIFLVFTWLGAIFEATAVTNFGDMMILGMAFPNLVGVLLLSGQLKADLDVYWRKLERASSRATSRLRSPAARCALRLTPGLRSYSNSCAKRIVPLARPSSTMFVPPLFIIHSRRWSRYWRTIGMRPLAGPPASSVFRHSASSRAFLLHARALAAAREPGREPREAVAERHAEQLRRPEMGKHRRVAAPEARAVHELAAFELALEAPPDAPQLLAGARRHLGRLLGLGALEVVQLHQPPVDRLELRVAHLLEHADARAIRRRVGHHRRPRPVSPRRSRARSSNRRSARRRRSSTGTSSRGLASTNSWKLGSSLLAFGFTKTRWTGIPFS